nr:transposase [Actinocrispum wychmicini]
MRYFNQGRAAPERVAPTPRRLVSWLMTPPYSNGPAEGVNAKIKLLKRQTYGRTSFSLLRKRILPS